MNFFSDERFDELRNIFFESAQELLQALNDEGLVLERNPSDPEVVRNIRRTVHTLKGDSAACGYRELSDLAHELEDVLTPELAKSANGSLADLVLSAADIFDAMLAAYKGSMQPPAGDSLRAMIARIVAPAIEADHDPLLPGFAWTEYERLVISEHAVRGQSVYNVALVIDLNCPMRAAALQLISNVLQEVGTVLVMHPDESTAPADVKLVEVALASHHGEEWIAKKGKIPSVVSRILVQKCAGAEDASATTESPTETDVLGILTEVPDVPVEAALAAPTIETRSADTVRPVENEKAAVRATTARTGEHSASGSRAYR